MFSSIFLKRSLVFPILLFSSISLQWSLRKAFLSLLAILCGTAAAAKSLQLCPTLCDSIDGSPPGSAVPGILQARTLEWVAISFSNARKWKVNVKSLSHVRLLATPWTAAYQAPPSMGFSRQEYWSGVPLPSPDNRVHQPLVILCITDIEVKWECSLKMTTVLFSFNVTYI